MINLFFNSLKLNNNINKYINNQKLDKYHKNTNHFYDLE